MAGSDSPRGSSLLPGSWYLATGSVGVGVYWRGEEIDHWIISAMESTQKVVREHWSEPGKETKSCGTNELERAWGSIRVGW